MRPGYIVLLVALQLAASMPTDLSTTEDTPSTSELPPVTEPEIFATTNSSLTDTSTESTSTEMATDASDDEIEEDLRYTQENETTTESATTLTTRAPPVQSTTPSLATTLVSPSALVLLIPTCLHLLSKGMGRV